MGVGVGVGRAELCAHALAQVDAPLREAVTEEGAWLGAHQPRVRRLVLVVQLVVHARLRAMNTVNTGGEHGEHGW
jgi:hypothetical protein